jgi:DNA polymerase IV
MVKFMNKIIMHLDMNSYFASVEQQANPFLRGRAVGVCSYLSPGGCIIASSMEAKAKGIKTGCRVNEAKVLDPKVVLVENEPAKYRSTTEKIFAILSSYGGAVEPYSIDEAFIDLTGWVNNFDKATCLAREIQFRIKEEVGVWLNCSVGISWTKFLAKFAGDIAPKKSILAIEDKLKLTELLRGRSLCDAWGINVRTETRLNLLGIKSLLDFKNYSEDKIRRSLGRYGYYLWANVNGIEISQVGEGSPAPKSIGHSYCLPKRTTDKDYLRGVLYKLCEKAGRRLRDSDLEAESMHVGWSYLREGGYFRSFKTKEKLFTTEEIFKYANQVLEKAQLAMPVRMLAVSVGSLSSVTSQMSFFEDNLSKKDLSRALDKINDKFGEFTVVRGQMFGTEDMARDRIGFRKVN